MSDGIVSAESIIKFMNEHEGVMIIPFKDLEKHIKLTKDVGKCPCDKLNNRLECPCSLAIQDLSDYPYCCKCTLFINKSYPYFSVDKIKDHINFMLKDINEVDELIELYRLILNLYYKRLVQ